jgi:hypothetical protein
VLSPAMQTELKAMARRMKFELGSERELGTWRCELGGYFWWAKANDFDVDLMCEADLKCQGSICNLGSLEGENPG